MADIEYLKSKLTAHPDFPKKVRLQSFATEIVILTMQVGNRLLGYLSYPS